MPTAAELLASACTSGISCLNEKNLLVAIAQGASAGGGGGGGGGGTLSTDGTFAANSDLLYPSQKAAKTYVDTSVAAALVTASGLYVLKAGDTMTGALLLPNGAVGAPSLSHVADANTGLWYPAADTIAFSTAGAERVRIDSAGAVGIGTTGPGAFLDINSGATAGPQLRLARTGRAYDFILSNDDFNLRDVTAGNLVRITLDTLGKVGIGTTVPLAKLHVTPSASGTDYFRIDHSDGTPRLQVGVYTGAPTLATVWLGNIVPSVTNFSFFSDGTSLAINGSELSFLTGAVTKWTISSAGHLIAATDNTYDIGASGATRPRDVFVARTITTLNLTQTTAGLFSVTSGANQRAGNATLVGGTVTVSNTTVTANTIVLLTRKVTGGTIGFAVTYTLSAATSFTITSDNALDTSTYSYLLIEVP